VRCSWSRNYLFGLVSKYSWCVKQLSNSSFGESKETTKLSLRFINLNVTFIVQLYCPIRHWLSCFVTRKYGFVWVVWSKVGAREICKNFLMFYSLKCRSLWVCAGEGESECSWKDRELLSNGSTLFASPWSVPSLSSENFIHSPLVVQPFYPYEYFWRYQRDNRR
jgi:hypothetical protein